jgi:hypothetical protein
MGKNFKTRKRNLDGRIAFGGILKLEELDREYGLDLGCVRPDECN